MSQNSSKSHTRVRIRLSELAACIVCFLFISFFSFKYLIRPAADSNARALRNTIIYDAVRNYALEGDIVDRDGALIMGNAAEGIPAYAPAGKNRSYAYLLGYYTVSQNRENKYGLRGSLNEYLLFTLDKANKGATVTLTTDNALQNYAFESILNGQEGSVIVLDNKTGDVLCFTSKSNVDYDVNDMESFIGSDVEGAQFRRGTFENDPPGSTFKIVTAAAAIEKDIDEKLPDDFFAYNDTGEYYAPDSDFIITNYEHAVWGQVDLEKAMNNSVNCYFANLGVKIGAERMNRMARNLMIGSDIKIPFLCTIHSRIDISNAEPVTIAQTAFGQGNTEITPFHLALIAQAMANDGKMMQPNIVKRIQSGNSLLYKSNPSVLKNCFRAKIAEQLKPILHSTAVGYGIDEASCGMVYAKTGTAECANDRIHTYIIGFTEDASFCISMNNSEHSSDLWPKAKQLVQFINQIYARE